MPWPPQKSMSWALLLLAIAGAGCLWLVLKRALGGATDPRSAADPIEADAKPRVKLEIAARGFHTVTDIQFVPGSSEHALVLVKSGQARYVSFAPGTVVNARDCPLVLSVDVRQSSELGLLGLAFHPKYAENGLFYLNYTPASGERRTRISEWQLGQEQLGRARARERRIILEVEQPYDNHNAGQLAFGPDNMLYVGLGDGGKAHDPLKHGQNLGTLLGSMLRIDIDRRDNEKQYAIPRDNPFVDKPGARAEIWAYGLRNPWRYSFDDRGRLVVADVGQDRYEEVDIVGRGSNLGWAQREARHCLGPAPCASEGFSEPLFEYDHGLGKSIIGGYQYLGTRLSWLKSKYLVADYESGRLWALTLPASGHGSAESQELGQFQRLISTFGRDALGELYLGDFGSGDLLRLVSAAR